MKYTILKEITKSKIYVCGYCNEILLEKSITKHLKKIHNVTKPQVSDIITKVIMI